LALPLVIGGLSFVSFPRPNVQSVQGNRENCHPYRYDTMADTLTQSQILLSTLAKNSLRPEWIRLNVAVALFGISRSRFYDLIAEKKIKSFTLRERNQIKGTRLLSYDSICEFLEKEAQAEQEPDES
jgi:hypothetical protein